MIKDIKLVIHDDYFKALDELREEIYKKYDINYTIDDVAAIVIRNHVINDLNELKKSKKAK